MTHDSARVLIKISIVSLPRCDEYHRFNFEALCRRSGLKRNQYRCIQVTRGKFVYVLFAVSEDMLRHFEESDFVSHIKIPSGKSK